MKTFRAKFNHGNHAWTTHGRTREEAYFQMLDSVELWAVTTGNPIPTGSVQITDVTEDVDRQVAEYLEAIKTPGTPSPTSKAQPSPDCTGGRCAGARISSGGR